MRALRRFLLADERGSVVAITNVGGGLLGTNRYDEYGIPATTDIGRFQYTGQTWLPELGLYYYKARMYSPTLGRFMQTDPIGYADGMNWYDYVGGDPTNGKDPGGTLDVGPDIVVRCDIACRDRLDRIRQGKEMMLRLSYDGILMAQRDPSALRDRVPVDCDDLIQSDQGTIQDTSFSLSITPILGFNMAGGSFRNPSTGASGLFKTQGVGVGWDVGASASYGQVLSLRDFAGYSWSLSVASGAAGSISLSDNGTVTGLSAGVSTFGKGASISTGNTELYSCSVPR